MNSILEPLRRSTKLDSNEERVGISCGRRWATNYASSDELGTVAALTECPLSWFDDINGTAFITPERLVDIIGGATRSPAECVDFWNQHCGDSHTHAVIWKTPAFTRGFVTGAAQVRAEQTVVSPEA